MDAKLGTSNSLPCVIDGFHYRLAQPGEEDVVTLVVATAFSMEPSSLHCKLGEPFTERHWQKFAGNFVREAIPLGLVVVACLDDEKTVVGAFVLRDFFTPWPEEVTKLFAGTTGQHLGRVIHILDERWEKAHEEDMKRWERNPGHVIDLLLLAVAPEALGKGIANNLTKLSIELARSRNFEVAVIECTGHFSQRAAEKSGFKLVAEMAYTDYDVDGIRPFDSVPLPHTKWALYEINLH